MRTSGLQEVAAEKPYLNAVPSPGMVGLLVCPHCGAHVHPIRGPGGKNVCPVCPVCQNTGRPVPFTVPGQPAGGMPQAGATAASRSQAPGAVASLVCGIVGVVTGMLGIVLGPIAIWQASAARKAMAREPGRYDGDGLATAGRILGIVGLVIGALGILVAAFVFASVARLGDLIDDAPDVDFATSEETDQISVVAVQDGVVWEDFEAGGSAGCMLPAGPVDVGDVVQCDGPGTAWLRHVPSGDLVYETSFAD